MIEPLKTLQSKFTPDPGYPQPYRLDQQFLAFWVGAVAFGLPLVMLLATQLNFPQSRACFRASISHFYYEPFFGDLFVGALFFIGTFLLAYRGQTRLETRLASWAGVFAFGVAIFPTTGPGCGAPHMAARALAELEQNAGGFSLAPGAAGHLFQLFPSVNVLHFVSAGALFGFLAFYCFFVFTRPSAQTLAPDGRSTRVKKARNSIYYTTGTVILLAMAAMALHRLTGLGGTAWNAARLTFYCEAAALFAFGLAWMVKGRFWGNILLDPGEPGQRVRAS